MISLDLDIYSLNVWFNQGDFFNLTIPTWLVATLIIGVLIKKKFFHKLK